MFKVIRVLRGDEDGEDAEDNEERSSMAPSGRAEMGADMALKHMCDKHVGETHTSPHPFGCRLDVDVDVY